MASQGIGTKFGGGGIASASESNVERRERLRKLALESIDLAKDPYILRNHLGGIECRLCLTLHTNEGSYLAHTQGKKHQANLGRRAAKEKLAEAQNAPVDQAMMAAQAAYQVRKNIIKIGRPGYKVTKIRDVDTNQLGLLFQIQYPEIGSGITPRYRFMSAYEQHVEPPNKAHQYLLFAAEPYETISFKIQAKEIDRDDHRFFTHFDPDMKVYSLQMFFRA